MEPSETGIDSETLYFLTPSSGSLALPKQDVKRVSKSLDLRFPLDYFWT